MVRSRRCFRGVAEGKRGSVGSVVATRTRARGLWTGPWQALDQVVAKRRAPNEKELPKGGEPDRPQVGGNCRCA